MLSTGKMGRFGFVLTYRVLHMVVYGQNFFRFTAVGEGHFEKSGQKLSIKKIIFEQTNLLLC